MTPPNELIRASAGTGKTFSLSNRYLRLLLDDVRPDAILATTFTRKAAGEILDRILGRLAEATRSETDAAALSGHLGIAPRPPEAFAAALHELVAELHQVRVSTLDAYFAKRGQAYALELGLPAGWRILDPPEIATARLRAIDRLLTSLGTDATSRLLGLLDKGEAKRSVRANIADAVETFGDVTQESKPDAWRWLRPGPEPDAGELHTLCDAIRRSPETFADDFPKSRKGLTTALAKAASLGEAGDWGGVVSAKIVAASRDREPMFGGQAIPDPVVPLLDRLLATAQAAFVRELAEQGFATDDLMSGFGRLFREEKAKLRGLEFSDVTQALADSEQAEIGYRLDGEVRHLLIDEFQDTSIPQWEVIQPLVTSVDAAGGSVFCVGDVKQAIYGWRGGVAAVFDAFSDAVPQIESHSLERSYRSSPVIIEEAVNGVFANLDRVRSGFPGVAAVARWRDRFRPHQTARQDLSGYAELATYPEFEGDAERVRPQRWAWIADRVAEMRAARPAASVGILARSNSEVAGVAASLRALGVPVSEEGGELITDSVPVLLVRSLLLLADHPGDTAARFHVASTPLGPIAGLTRHDDDEAAYRLSDRLRTELATGSFGQFVRSWTEPLIPLVAPRDHDRMRQLIAIADRYDGVPDASVAEFVRVIEDTKIGEPSEALVRLMTIHGSKGLEFDIVVLPQLDDAVAKPHGAGFATSRSQPAGRPDRLLRYRSKKIQDGLPAELQAVYEESAAAGVDEGLCLLYVAMTRARHALHLFVVPRGKAIADGSAMLKPAEVLCQTLSGSEPIEPESTVWSAGDPDWLPPPSQADETAPPTTVRSRLRPSAADVRDRVRLSPSRLAKTAERTQSLRDEVQSEPAGSAAHADDADADLPECLTRTPPGLANVRGTLLHRWFQEIAWSGDPIPPEERLRQLAHFVRAPRVVTSAALRDFQALLRSDAVCSILDRDRYESAAGAVVAVRTEQSFAIPGPAGQGILAGSFDRLTLLQDHRSSGLAAEVIDWKTDRVGSSSEMAASAQAYRPQLAAYQFAVAAMYGIPRDRVAARLVYLNADRVVTISGPELASTEIAPVLRTEAIAAAAPAD